MSEKHLKLLMRLKKGLQKILKIKVVMGQMKRSLIAKVI